MKEKNSVQEQGGGWIRNLDSKDVEHNMNEEEEKKSLNGGKAGLNLNFYREEKQGLSAGNP